MKVTIAIPLLIACCLLSACSTMDKKAVLSLTKAGYEGKELQSSIKEIEKKGFWCQSIPVGNNPTPVMLKYTSDGTFNAVKMYQCMKQSDYFFWLTTTYTYVMGQYDKVVGIGHIGSYKSSVYLFGTGNSRAACISKCLGPDGELH